MYKSFKEMPIWGGGKNDDIGAKNGYFGNINLNISI